MIIRWAILCVVVGAIGCWGPRVEPPIEEKPPPKEETGAKEDPAAVAAMKKLQEGPLRGMVLKYDTKVAHKPMIGVQIIGGGPPGEEGPLKHLAGLVHLRELTIQLTPDLSPKVLAGLEKLSELKSLDLNHSRIGDEALALIGQMKQLEVLRIRSAVVTAKGLKHLAGLTSLRELDLGNCLGVTDESAEHLAALTQLQVLLLPRCANLTDAGLTTLGKLTGLERLDLEGCKVGDAGVKALAGLRALKQLNLNDTVVGNEGLAALKGLPLEELNLNRTRSTGKGLDSFPKLQRVHLRDLAKPDEALTALAAVPYLRELDLSDADLGDAALPRLKEMKQLRVLDISGTKITSGGLMQLPDLPSLIKVTVSVVANGDPESEITSEAVATFREQNPRIAVVE